MHHIGAYITLSTIIVSVLGLESFKERVAAMRCYLAGTLGFFVLAGVCGGVVASSIPFFKTFDEFRRAKIGPFFAVHAFPSVWWMTAEHLAFWAGVACALAGLAAVHKSPKSRRGRH